MKQFACDVNVFVSAQMRIVVEAHDIKHAEQICQESLDVQNRVLAKLTTSDLTTQADRIEEI